MLLLLLLLLLSLLLVLLLRSALYGALLHSGTFDLLLLERMQQQQ